MAEKEKLLELKNVVYSFHTYGARLSATSALKYAKERSSES